MDKKLKLLIIDDNEEMLAALYNFFIKKNYDVVATPNSLHALKLIEAEKKGLLEKKPWIMVAPMLSSKNKFVQDMKSKYGAVTIGFSGWAQSTKFSFGRRTDYSIPMSDHCDYNELIDMVIQSEAEQVYTIHGFVDEFAEDLRKRGISAQPLLENSLDDFT